MCGLSRCPHFKCLQQHIPLYRYSHAQNNYLANSESNVVRVPINSEKSK